MTNTSLHELLRKASGAYAAGRFADAFSLYKELAQGGHGESQVFVGWMLLNGIGVTANSAEAADWFERSARLGSPQGTFYWARYLTSQGRHRDAFAWYQKAAALNYLPGIFWAGYCFAKGKGVSPNICMAYKYLAQATEQGHLFAQRELAVLDVKGHRGFLYRITGTVSFIGAVLRSIFVSKSDSEKLCG